MRGHALFLADDNGGPHIPPNPARKFESHWIVRQAAGARQVLGRLEPSEALQLPKEFRDLAMVGLALDPTAAATPPRRRNTQHAAAHAQAVAELPIPPWVEPALEREALLAGVGG
jgi:hypothetical protein